MKTYYLHISYIGQSEDGNLKFGNALVVTGSGDLLGLRKQLNESMKCKEPPIIMSISVLPKDLYEMLVDKEEKQ